MTAQEAGQLPYDAIVEIVSVTEEVVSKHLLELHSYIHLVEPTSTPERLRVLARFRSFSCRRGDCGDCQKAIFTAAGTVLALPIARSASP